MENYNGIKFSATGPAKEERKRIIGTNKNITIFMYLLFKITLSKYLIC
jgi:hypothetical protein